MQPSPVDRPEPIMTPGEDLARAFDQEVGLIDYDMLRKTLQEVFAKTVGDRDYGIFEAVHLCLPLPLVFS